MLCNSCGSASGNPGFCTSCGKSMTAAAPVQGMPKPAPPIVERAGTAGTEQFIDDAHAETRRSYETGRKSSIRGRDPRQRSRVVPLLIVSLAGLLVIGGSSAALWWLFSGAGNDSASSSETGVAPGGYGSNAELDALWDECAEGLFSACDDLYFTSAEGSEYERFGATCGNRAEASGSCALLGGLSDPAEDGAFGSDLALDLLWTECEGGDMAACDDLYLESPVGSEYEEFGAGCGGKGDATGDCVSRFP